MTSQRRRRRHPGSLPQPLPKAAEVEPAAEVAEPVAEAVELVRVVAAVGAAFEEDDGQCALVLAARDAGAAIEPDRYRPLVSAS